MEAQIKKKQEMINKDQENERISRDEKYNN